MPVIEWLINVFPAYDNFTIRAGHKPRYVRLIRNRHAMSANFLKMVAGGTDHRNLLFQQDFLTLSSKTKILRGQIVTANFAWLTKTIG